MDSNYDSSENLGIYLQFHFGGVPNRFASKFGMEGFQHFNEQVLQRFLKIPKQIGSSALDLGCSVGGATFLLSRTFDKVIGIDLSQSFISAARRLKENGSMEFSVKTIGEEVVLGKAFLPDGVKRNTVEFEVGNACELRTFGDAFDCVVALNLVCRTPDPESVLNNFANLILPGGQLILTMPMSWSDEFTPKKLWIKGDPIEFLKNKLNPFFELEDFEDIAFLMRETERKHHWCVSLCSSWTRK